jgi:hypothetical protein
MRPQPDTQYGVAIDQQKAASILQGFSTRRLTCRYICDKCAGDDAGCTFVPSTKTTLFSCLCGAIYHVGFQLQYALTK